MIDMPLPSTQKRLNWKGKVVDCGPHVSYGTFLVDAGIPQRMCPWWVDHFAHWFKKQRSKTKQRMTLKGETSTKISGKTTGILLIFESLKRSDKLDSVVITIQMTRGDLEHILRITITNLIFRCSLPLEPILHGKGWTWRAKRDSDSNYFEKYVTECELFFGKSG